MGDVPSVVQPALPGLDTPKRRRSRSGRRGSTARVWTDPAVVEATGAAAAKFTEWRSAFAGFLARLPEARRRELRQRIAGDRPKGTNHAA